MKMSKSATLPDDCIDALLLQTLTLDTGTFDDLNVFETGQNVATDVEANLDAVVDTFLDVDGILLDLCKLLLGLLEVDRDDSTRCRWRYEGEAVQRELQIITKGPSEKDIVSIVPTRLRALMIALGGRRAYLGSVGVDSASGSTDTKTGLPPC